MSPIDAYQIGKIVTYLRSKIPAAYTPEIAIVCGSGLSGKYIISYIWY